MITVKCIEGLFRAILLVTVTLTIILPGAAILIKDDTSNPRLLFSWCNELSVHETSGSQDTFELGESDSATDGLDFPPIDIEHAPFPPPYLAIYSTVENRKLAKDTRLGPAETKTWDVDVQWLSSSSNPTIITLSWQSNGFNGCEYNSIVLMRYDSFNDLWDIVADMLIEEEYVYSPIWFNGQWLTDHFQITAVLDIKSPEISDVTLTTSELLDTVIGWENFSCTVIDDIETDEVKLILTDSTLVTTEYSMIKDDDNYYCNITVSTADAYTYYIWADDLSGNENTSTSQPFELPLNEDVNIDGWCHFMDVVAVSLMYNDFGTAGWVREDVDNNGVVHFTDIIEISLQYGNYWI